MSINIIQLIYSYLFTISLEDVLWSSKTIKSCHDAKTIASLRDKEEKAAVHFCINYCAQWFQHQCFK